MADGIYFFYFFIFLTKSVLKRRTLRNFYIFYICVEIVDLTREGVYVHDKSC